MYGLLFPAWFLCGAFDNNVLLAPISAFGGYKYMCNCVGPGMRAAEGSDID